MFARTKRLTLRPGWPEDAAALAQAIAHESVVAGLSRVPWPYTVDDATRFLEMPRQADDALFLILAHEETTPRVVGTIGIHADRGAWELGYWLTPSAWGRGYATEAGRAVVEIARHTLPIRRLGSGYFVDNPASGRVLRKLGFREAGRTEPRHSVARGGPVDTVVMELDLEDRPQSLPMAA